MFIMIFNIPSLAQISGDNNWNTTPYFIDEFNTTGRSWQTNFTDYPLLKWRANSVECGVTHGPYEHQVYQKENCVFNYVDGTIELVSEYKGGPMQCADYIIPPGYSCNPNDTSLYYFSGEIDALRAVPDFLYGYFEMQCKLPVHRGAFPAFWLWGGNGCYEEIDIFEYSWGITDPVKHPESPFWGNSQMFTSGLYFAETAYDPRDSYARERYVIPDTDPDLTSWNTFSCEWSPGRVVWYFNGVVVNEVSGDFVPYRPMCLKSNYAIDNWIREGGVLLTTGFPYKLEINYIKVHKLKCDCDENSVINDNSALSTYNYEVKQSVSIGSSGNNIIVPTSTEIVFRATDYIEITQNFELPVGSEMELITHPCPE